MLLKEIIINGFKSFANRTKIELGPGVTTIVGPNGCGKSNVVDAIRWVLGEQSAKALRGGSMQDVIFAGTEKRAALGICEVTLLFTECEKQLGTAFNEVEIMRRVSRDGASNYYLNGKTCRLKDIQELFMDTGVGRVSYSFMVQGQIDQILSTNPAERRVIFEEAAGVTRYKSQRREALNKLEQVDQNLSRVQDVVDEVSRQIGSLKRQASKAIRYKKVKHRMSHLDLAVNSYNYQQRQECMGKLEEKVEGLKEFVGGLQGIQEVEEEIVGQKKGERGQLYEKLQSVQQGIFDLRMQKDQLENRSGLALVRKSDAQMRIEEIRKELKVIEGQTKELEDKAKDDSYFKQLQLDLVFTSDTTYQEKSQKIDEVQKRLLEAEQGLQNKKKELLKVEGELNRLRIKNGELEVVLNTNNNQVSDLSLKKVEGEAHLEELRKQYENIQKELKIVEKSQEKEEQRLKEAQQKVVKRIEVLKGIQNNVQEEDRQLARLNAQVNALEGLQSKFEGFSDGAKAILQGKLGDLAQREYGLLSKCVEVEEAYTRALETLLGPGIDAIALEELGQAITVTMQLEEKDLGRACLSIGIERKAKRMKKVELPDFLKRAGDVVIIKDEKLKQRWDQLLEGCYFAESLEKFLEYWQGNPEFDFQLLATEHGELVDARGLIYGGVKRGRSEGSGFLQRESQIRGYKKKVDEQKKILDKLMEEVKEAQEKVEEAEEDLEDVRKRVAQTNEKIAGLKIESRQGQVAMERNEQLINRTVEQLNQINKTYNESKKHLDEGVKALQKIQGGMDGLREGVTKDEELIIKIRQERDDQREVLSEMRVELAERRQKLEMIDQGLSETENRRKGLIHRQEQRQKDMHRFEDQIQQLQNESEECKIRVAELEKVLVETIGNLERERQGLMLIEGVIKELDEKLTSRRKELHGKETLLRNSEVELAKERSQVNYMIEKVRSEYDVDIAIVNWKEQLWLAQEELDLSIALEELDDVEEILTESKLKRGEPSEEDFAMMEGIDWAQIQKEVKILRDRINGMGVVNLVAIEEYMELKERHEFLEKQCNDLKGAKEQLLKAIEEINETSQQLFKDTFEKVRQNFQFTFDALFGGGVADLQLNETEDMLEAGIEIIARPPGTKLKSLSLLSGGQKTMTAVALLFAIYKVKPSPFCVLDELDAPLDDANIGRFTNMLREFTRYSQFLVISHNRRTIAASDTIYGVTMQEKGVTALISMRFNKKDKEPVDRVEEFLENSNPKAEMAEI